MESSRGSYFHNPHPSSPTHFLVDSLLSSQKEIRGKARDTAGRIRVAWGDTKQMYVRTFRRNGTTRTSGESEYFVEGIDDDDEEGVESEIRKVRAGKNEASHPSSNPFMLALLASG